MMHSEESSKRIKANSQFQIIKKKRKISDHLTSLLEKYRSVHPGSRAAETFVMFLFINRNK